MVDHGTALLLVAQLVCADQSGTGRSVAPGSFCAACARPSTTPLRQISGRFVGDSHFVGDGGPALQALWDGWTWKPIRGCDGRYTCRDARSRSLDTTALLAGMRTEKQGSAAVHSDGATAELSGYGHALASPSAAPNWHSPPPAARELATPGNKGDRVVAVRIRAELLPTPSLMLVLWHC